MRIRVSCPDCGEIVLEKSDVTVRVCAEDRQGSYYFRCSGCMTRVAHPISDTIVRTLVSAGVNLQIWHWPAELFETSAGDTITCDDILDFHQLLDSEEWCADQMSQSERIAKQLDATI